MELGERAWIMREALERARHGLALLAGCIHTSSASTRRCDEGRSEARNAG
jgi:hypothetical protein